LTSVFTDTAFRSLTFRDVTTAADLLAGVDLFKELRPEELARLAEQSTSETLRRGDIVFREGDEPDRLYVVIQGRIAISKRSLDGREAVVALVEDGDLFGEMGFFLPLGRSAEARALEPSTLLAVAFAPVRQIYEERPELLWGVVSMLADRVRIMDDVLADSVFLERHFRGGVHEVVDEAVDRVERGRPRALHVAETGALRQPALTPHCVAGAFELARQPLVHRDHLVEGVRELAFDAGEVRVEPVGEVALLESYQTVEEMAGNGGIECLRRRHRECLVQTGAWGGQTSRDLWPHLGRAGI
jgi:CRP-like cAMP-binding protein